MIFRRRLQCEPCVTRPAAMVLYGGFKMEARINAALDEIRKVLAQDGGSIELVGITEDNQVKVRLTGHCVGCPGVRMTPH